MALRLTSAIVRRGEQACQRGERFEIPRGYPEIVSQLPHLRGQALERVVDPLLGHLPPFVVRHTAQRLGIVFQLLEAFARARLQPTLTAVATNRTAAGSL
jgi:hypothetical protein